MRCGFPVACASRRPVRGIGEPDGEGVVSERVSCVAIGTVLELVHGMLRGVLGGETGRCAAVTLGTEHTDRTASMGKASGFERMWVPVIGTGYARKLAPVMRTVLICLGLFAACGMAASIVLGAGQASLVAVVVASVLFFAPLVAMMIALLRFARFGRRIRADLRDAGINVRRSCSVSRPGDVTAWAARNDIDLAFVAEVGNRKYLPGYVPRQVSPAAPVARDPSSARAMALKPGISALTWFRVCGGVYVFFVVSIAWMIAGVIAPSTSRLVRPTGIALFIAPWVVGTMLLLGMSIVYAHRDKAEKAAGYTTLPFAHQPYSLVDRKTGEVVRPAGQAPLRSRVAVGLKAERARAAAASGRESGRRG